MFIDISSVLVWPLPTADLGQVIPTFANILLVFEPLIAHQLFDVRATPLEFWHAVNDIHNQMKAIQIVQDDHIEWCSSRTLLLVSAHVEVSVVCPPVSQPVDQPGVAVKRKDYR